MITIKILIKKIFSLFNVKKKDLFKVTFINLITLFLEIIGLIFIPIFLSIIIGANPKNYSFISAIVDHIPRNKLLLIASLGFLLVFILKNILIIYLKAVTKKIILDLTIDLRSKLLKSYQIISYDKFVKKENISYVRNLTDHIERSSVCLESIFNLCVDIIILFIMIIYLIILNLEITLSFLTIIIIVIYSYYLISKNRVNYYGYLKNSASQKIYQSITENFSGFKEVTLLKKHYYFYNSIIKNLKIASLNELKFIIITQSPRYILEITIIFFLVLLLIFVSLNNLNIQDIIITLSVYLFALLRIIPSSSNLLSNITKIRYNRSSIDVIFEDLNLKKEKKINKNNENKILINKVSFKNIFFKYPGTKKWIFKKLNFTINRNECIGIIGENGSGKTTFIDILLGLLKPNSGEIHINNKKVKKKQILWNNQVGYLPQEKLILNKSIAENISLEEKSNINKIEIYKSIKKTTLEKKINTLPNKLETIIGENGTRLSGGEYAKIVIARLFYHEKNIIVMDESTNFLDLKSEITITNEIKKMKGKKTIVIISHNSNSLKYCDKIYKLENCRLKKIKKNLL